MPATIGDRLRKLRERRGWTQLQVADKTGISNYNVSNYENHRRVPDTETILKFAEFYDVDFAWLATGKKADGTKDIEEEWKDLEKELLESGAQWSYEGDALTPEAKRRIMDIVRYVMASEKNNPKK